MDKKDRDIRVAIRALAAIEVLLRQGWLDRARHEATVALDHLLQRELPLEGGSDTRERVT